MVQEFAQGIAGIVSFHVFVASNRIISSAGNLDGWGLK